VWENILASSIVMLTFVAVSLAIYALIGLRGLQQRRAYFARLHAELAPGQTVALGSGIYGTTVAVRSDTVDIRVKSGALMTVSRYAISAIVKEEQHHAQHSADAH